MSEKIHYKRRKNKVEIVIPCLKFQDVIVGNKKTGGTEFSYQKSHDIVASGGSEDAWDNPVLD